MKSRKARRGARTTGAGRTAPGRRLLSGGNPRIPKGDGPAPVRAYIAALPGWKRAVGRRIDAAIEGAVPGVRRSVRWNSPFYGVEGRDWFLSYHCMTKYIKVGFLRGASLRPPPPEPSKVQGVRYFHIHEGEPFDEARFADWVRQAAALPGVDPSKGAQP